jgi:hypothetical protein
MTLKINRSIKLFFLFAIFSLVLYPPAVSTSNPSARFFARSIVSVQALVSSNVTVPAELQQVTFSLNSYAPAQIIISYAYTSSFNISKVSSVGLSLYKIISGPTSINFQASDVDVYHFSVDINYGNILVTQTIQIAVFSGNLPPDGTSFSVKASEVRFDFTLTVTKQPAYPSVNDVAQAVVNQLSNQLQQFQVRQDAFVAEISNTILAIGGISVFAAACVLVLIVFVLRLYRQLARLEEKGVQ